MIQKKDDSFQRSFVIVFVVLQIEDEFRNVAASFGIEYDAMCVTDNTNCDGEP